jgi:hypothetical protein
MATTSSIGGPPIALLYQDTQGGRIRGTLSGFFLVGLVISLGALSFVGRFGRPEIRATLYLLPAVGAGFLLSTRVAAFLDRGHTRKAILWSSGLAGIAVVVQGILSRT